jgi:hypothetical protein
VTGTFLWLRASNPEQAIQDKQSSASNPVQAIQQSSQAESQNRLFQNITEFSGPLSGKLAFL